MLVEWFKMAGDRRGGSRRQISERARSAALSRTAKLKEVTGATKTTDGYKSTTGTLDSMRAIGPLDTDTYTEPKAEEHGVKS